MRNDLPTLERKNRECISSIGQRHASRNNSVGSEDEGGRREISFPQGQNGGPIGHRGGPQGTRRLNYDQRVIDGILSGEAESLRFVSDFWAFTPSEQDKVQFRKFCRFVKSYAGSGNLSEASASVGIYLTTGHDWLSGTTIPFMARLYRTYVSLGKPEHGNQWLPVRIARNGSSFKQLIQVPAEIQSELDIQAVLKQLGTKSSVKEFGFVLGVMLGDAGKGMNIYINGNHRIPSMNLYMALSQSREYSDRFARHTAACCQDLGLNMYRIADKSPSEKQLKSKSKAKNYCWRSERSPLFAWMHVVCLGLGIRETTTKTPIKMEWILRVSRAFRVAFLQGIAESDGSVSHNGYARIESWPNSPFIAQLVRSLGAKCSFGKKGSRMAGVVMTIDQAGSIDPFSEQVVSERYTRLRKMIGAERLRTWPAYISAEVRRLSETTKAPDITRKLLQEHNIFIRPHSITRYLRRTNSKPPPPFFKLVLEQKRIS